ncbi:MAG TPA: hypothetical protein VFL69_05295 [Marmoricola sp.]|nr:hypothetical protein [Marmoricola sp.]
MAAGLIVIVALVVAAIIIVVVTLLSGGRFLGRQGRVQEEAKTSSVDMLRYRVPEGQDPAVVLAALQKEGFEAIPDLQGSGSTQDVLIPCEGGVDRHRAHVRSVIQSTDRINIEGDRTQIPRVRFADEVPGA